MEFDRRIKTTALYQSQGINLQNSVRLFRYSYWLLHNFSVNFDDQKLTDTVAVASTVGSTSIDPKEQSNNGVDRPARLSCVCFSLNESFFAHGYIL